MKSKYLSSFTFLSTFCTKADVCHLCTRSRTFLWPSLKALTYFHTIPWLNVFFIKFNDLTMTFSCLLACKHYEKESHRIFHSQQKNFKFSQTNVNMIKCVLMPSDFFQTCRYPIHMHQMPIAAPKFQNGTYFKTYKVSSNYMQIYTRLATRVYMW